MRRPIAIGLSPNTEGKDVVMALRLLSTPWNYSWGECVFGLEQWFRKFFQVAFAVSFSSGRGALFAILKSLEVGKGDEVILQAFTCAVVPNVVIALGAKPVYVDTKKTFTMDPEDLERKVTNKTKAIVVQHTFGIAADLPAILRIAGKNKILVIEDVAHTIGATFRGKKLGHFGDAAFFSFGRDKAFSSVFGGVAITKDQELGKKLQSFQKKLRNPSFFWIAQQLFHPVAFFLILSLYNVLSLGKVLLVGLQKFRLLSFPVSKSEERGKVEKMMVKKMPNALACLALLQLSRLGAFNKKREAIAKLYVSRLPEDVVPVPFVIPYLRFPILMDNPESLIDFFRRKGIFLGTWYSAVVDPKGVDLHKLGYEEGSCPTAEYLARCVVNLPTYPVMTVGEAETVVGIFTQYGKSRANFE